jgi:hypothetical protein
MGTPLRGEIDMPFVVGGRKLRVQDHENPALVRGARAF